MRWEYCKVDLTKTTKHDDDISLLNRAGGAGWELVLVDPLYRALMRRPTDAGEAQSMQEQSTAPIAPKYRDPETGHTWTGRGRMATWLAEKIRAGRSLEDFLIKD